MSPRPYRLGQRQAATEQTRARIIAAARALLTASSGFIGFSMDAVARQADVARMTVYHQFGSKRGLLEALFDDLAARAAIGPRLGAAFAQSESLEALAALIAAFAHFWATDRLILRRTRALAMLDPEFEEGVRARDEWRRNGVQAVLRRVVEQHGRPSAEAFDEAVTVLYTLTSFETFDTLAGATRRPEEVTPVVQHLARAALGLDQ
jgi:AcrR family transcriptional regulator